MEWKEVRLGDVCSKIGSGATPSGGKEAYKGGDYHLIRSQNVLDFAFSKDGLASINDEQANKLKNVEIIQGDVLLNITGDSVARCCIVPSEILPARVNQHVAIIRPRKEELDNNYLLYYLQYNKRQLLQIASAGATRNAITKAMIENLILPCPKSLEDQRRIASILSSLDRKIELNNKINADLEEMAQAIFKNWFVDFEPFKDGKFVDSELGMIPEGWKVISLSEIMKYNGGSQPPASEFIDTYQEGYIRFIQIRDYDNDSHITYIPISKRNKLCDELDIMIARYGAALGRICWGLKGAYNVALAKVTPIKSYYREYLRCYLNTSYFYQSINNKGARCAQSGFNQSDINSYMIAFPIDEKVVMNFNDLCSSIMDKRLSLKYENSRLSLLRDTLLPRLMSGEIEIPE